VDANGGTPRSFNKGSAFDELAPALEEVGGILDEFASAIKHLFPGADEIFRGGFDCFTS
jgi:hypothetical protein